MELLGFAQQREIFNSEYQFWQFEFFGTVFLLVVVMTSSVEGQSYALAVEKKTVTSRFIALCNSMLEESKKFIVKEEGRIVV